jgi:hypothetical protein
VPKFFTAHLYKYIFFLLLLLPEFCRAQEADPYFGDAFEVDTLYAVRSAVKYDPIKILQGDFRLFYERMLAPHWSIEAGLGITRRNYTASWFYYELDNLGDNVDIKTRYAASLAGRYYFEGEEELFGLYVSLGISHVRHDKTYNVLDSSGVYTGDSFDDSRRYTSGIATVGYQALSPSSNVFLDFYVGAAVRYRNFQVVRSPAIYDPEAYTVTDETSFIGGLEVGVKIGFGF